ncbi:MAG: DUF4215 domain-containing protein [Deltaproteobacteria bacterium]|nr:MAG: DUF4215 domain-containing protein [Deltaproteobacteria bacterium]
MANVTVSNNTFQTNGVGAGIHNESNAVAYISHSTIAFNRSFTTGSGIGLNNSGGTVNVRNSIVSNSQTVALSHAALPNCSGTLSLSSNNLSNDTTCTGFRNGEPHLAALSYNGGSSQTHRLDFGSEAIDGVDLTTYQPFFDGVSPTGFFELIFLLDQRGSLRDGLHPDIGAYETSSRIRMEPVVSSMSFTESSPDQHFNIFNDGPDIMNLRSVSASEGSTSPFQVSGTCATNPYLRSGESCNVIVHPTFPSDCIILSDYLNLQSSSTNPVIRIPMTSTPNGIGTPACGGAPICGDGRTDSPETCDDRNTTSLDGCNSECRREVLDLTLTSPSITIQSGSVGRSSINVSRNGLSNSVPITLGSLTPVGITANALTIDDLGFASTTPVTTTANITFNIAPSVAPGTYPVTIRARVSDSLSVDRTINVIVTAPICGNNETLFPETCDDGNTASLDGCSSSCQEEFLDFTIGFPRISVVAGSDILMNYSITRNGFSDAVPIRVRRTLTSGEIQVAPSYSVPPLSTVPISPTIDSGIFTINIPLSVTPGIYDLYIDAVLSPTLTATAPLLLTVVAPPSSNVCGDSIKLDSEQCDDGNLNDTDGCNSVCQTEFFNIDISSPSAEVSIPQGGSGSVLYSAVRSNSISTSIPALMTLSSVRPAASITFEDLILPDDAGYPLTFRVGRDVSPGRYEVSARETLGNFTPITTYVATVLVTPGSGEIFSGSSSGGSGGDGSTATGGSSGSGVSSTGGSGGGDVGTGGSADPTAGSGGATSGSGGDLGGPEGAGGGISGSVGTGGSGATPTPGSGDTSSSGSSGGCSLAAVL